MYECFMYELCMYGQVHAPMCNTYLAQLWVMCFCINCVRALRNAVRKGNTLAGSSRFFPVVFSGSSPLPLLSTCIGRSLQREDRLRERLGRCFDSWGGCEIRRQQKACASSNIFLLRCWSTHILWLWNGAWAVPILSYVDLCVHS
jgi:hypothetical protein